MTHSAFTAVPVHPAHQAEHLADLAAAYRQALNGGPRGGSRTVKQFATMIDAFETRVSVLLGSTDMLGVGTNIQARCVALHHVDAPWRPADVEQREGRALRPGNLNPAVDLYRYVTEKSRSTRHVAGPRTQGPVHRPGHERPARRPGRRRHRRRRPVAEVKALATGNPLLLAKAEADAELVRLQRTERAHHRNQRELHTRITNATKRVASLTTLTEDIDTAIGRRRDTRGDRFAMTVDGVRHDKRRDAGQHLRQLIQHQLESFENGGRRASQARHGHLAGFDVIAKIRETLGSVQITLELDGAPGCTTIMTTRELGVSDPVRLIVGLETRLAGLEKAKQNALSEISRLETETDRAREDAAKAFPLSDQLHNAQRRAAEIEQQLQEAAKTSAQSDPPAGDKASPEPTAAGSSETGRRAGEADQAKIALRDFPNGAPVAVIGPVAARPGPSTPLGATLTHGIR